MKTVREIIIKALDSFSLEFDETVVAMLEERIQKLADPGRKVNRFAYVIARNWAISTIRKRTTAVKREAVALLAAEKARKEAERAEMIESLRKEFDAIVLQLLPRLHHTQPQQLAVARLVYFEGGLPPARFAELFPGATAHQRYQWVTRGVRLVVPHASQELREFLQGKSS